MKTILEKNIENENHSFTIRELKAPYFDPNWHFHPHYQLFTVLEGEGTRFIGDNIQHFSKGDTIFLGPNIPHLWQNDKSYFETGSTLKTHGVVVYFTEDFLGQGFFQKVEMTKIQHLLSKTNRGLVFRAKTKNFLVKELKNLLTAEGFEGVHHLLGILHQLSLSSDYDYITSVAYTNTHKKSETERMQKVHDYVNAHFKEDIQLVVVAAMVSMTISAFCRYFKNRTNKTFSEFVNEIRVGHASKLLQNQNVDISWVCYESGFNTLSNFNKNFKEITGKTPSGYRKVMVG